MLHAFHDNMAGPSAGLSFRISLVLSLSAAAHLWKIDVQR